MRPTRRDAGLRLLVGTAALLSGCAGLVGREPLSVELVGVDPLPGEGLEVRMAVKLRVQNPNDTALDYDGIALELDVRGRRFATGVSDARGAIARFGESLIVVPVSISALTMLRQLIDLARQVPGASPRLDYELRGQLAGRGTAGRRFASSGQLELPRGLLQP